MLRDWLTQVRSDRRVFWLWCAVALTCLIYLVVAILTVQVDFGVYRDGARAIWSPGDVYDLRFTVEDLPFTYPPFAALVFSPLALLPRVPAQLLWSVTALGCAVVYSWLCLRSYGQWLAQKCGRWLYPGLLFALLVSDPFMVGIGYGQVNMVLAVLIVLDLLGRTGRIPQGVLIGIAAAIKLTPLFLLVYLLVTRRIKAALIGGGVFVGATLLATAIWPGESWHYWDGVFADSDRIGGTDFVSNQSVNGLLVRTLSDGPAVALIWLVISTVCALAVLVACRRLWPAQPRVCDAIILATMLLVSPVSWTHHWILVLPLLLVSFSVFWRLGYPVLLGATSILSVLMVTGAIWAVPSGEDAERMHNISQVLLGNSYILLTAALVVALIAISLRSKAPLLTSGDAPRGSGTPDQANHP